MKKHNMKILLITALAIALVLSGCSSPSGTSSSTPPSNQAEPNQSQAGNSGADQGEQVLKVLRHPYETELEKQMWEEDLIGEFNKKHPDVKVELTTGDVNVDTGKLATTLQSGVTPPDTILIDSGPGRIKVLFEANLIQPLNDLYEKYDFPAKLDSYAFEKVVGNSGSDIIFELPSIMHANTIYYNKEIFEKSGAEVPATWDEYVMALQKVKDAGYGPITVGARNGYAIGWLFSNMLESVSGRDAVEHTFYTGGKWNDPDMVRAAEVLLDFVERGFIAPESVTQTQQDSEFTFLGNETSATVVAGNNFITKVIDAGMEDRVGWFRMPSIVDGKLTSPTGGIAKSWVVPTGAEHPELAELWFDFVLSEEFSAVVLGNVANNMIPASKAAAKVTSANQMMGELIQELNRDTAYNPTVYIGPETKEAYYQNLQGIIGKLLSAQEAMDNIEAGAEKDRASGYIMTK